MDGIEIKEILSIGIEQYKNFISTGLQSDEESLPIILRENPGCAICPCVFMIDECMHE